MLVERRGDREALHQLIGQFPITLLTGPRQCGKTTLAKSLDPSRYFLMSSPSEAEAFIDICKSRPQTSGLICVDEIQERPEILPFMRQWVDTRADITLLLLGSPVFMLEAALPKHLIGRMAAYHLGGFTLDDVGVENLHQLWSRGGFPQSYLAKSDELSFRWRQEYLASCPHAVMLRETTGASPHGLAPLIRSMSQYSGRILNYSNVSRSMGVSTATVQRYMQLLDASGLIRQVPPFVTSASASFRRSPKIYMRDSGLFACLVGLVAQADLPEDEHAPLIWEAFALETIAATLQRRRVDLRYWRDRTGAELDVVWEEEGRLVGAEITYSSRPRITKSMRSATTALDLAHLWVLHCGDETVALSGEVDAVPLAHFVTAPDSTSKPAVEPSKSSDSEQPSIRVFISYSHDDEDFVKKLVRALESADIDVTVDYEALRLGGSIDEFIRKAVNGTERTVLVVSEKSIRSPWVMAEFLETILYERFTSKNRLIPIYLDKEVFDPDLPLTVDKELESKIRDVDDRITTALQRGMDLEPFVGVRDRLRNLRFNIGKAVEKLTSVLCGDFSNPTDFQRRIDELLDALSSEEEQQD